MISFRCFWLLSFLQLATGFVRHVSVGLVECKNVLARCRSYKANGDSSAYTDYTNRDVPGVSISKESTSTSGTSEDDESSSVVVIREGLKEKLAEVAFRSERGFKASDSERKEARRIIFELAELNPTAQPAKDYYTPSAIAKAIESPAASPRLAGKWTLVYTDAPDIIGLEQNRFAVLGRIGQECDPPYIRNVIEWKRPSWADILPLAGTEPARALQKVVTEATSSPQKPFAVKLELVGLQIEGDPDVKNDDVRSSVQRRGLLPAFLEKSPLNLQGPIKVRFGDFEILYLDEELRIIRTGQGYFAVNRRVSKINEWF